MAPSQPQGSSGPWEWPQDGVTAGWAGSPRAGEQGKMGTGRKRVPGKSQLVYPSPVLQTSECCLSDEELCLQNVNFQGDGQS